MKKNQDNDILTFTLGLLFAAVWVIGGLILTKAIWPILKWIAKKAWDKLRGKRRPAQETEEEDAPEIEPLFKGNDLPTPDIFKGMPNLARARDLKF